MFIAILKQVNLQQGVIIVVPVVVVDIHFDNRLTEF